MTHGKRTANQNHLESPSPINRGRKTKCVLVELHGRPSWRRQQTDLP
jgi:hypothetical protein